MLLDAAERRLDELRLVANDSQLIAGSQRLLQLGGRLELDSAPGQGTKLRALVPYLS